MAILSFRDLFRGDLITSGTTSTVGDIVLALVVSLLISLFIYYVYKKTYSGVLYSRSFNISLIVTSLVVTGIIIGISTNLVLSLGMVGALSIVRFRTAIKDPRDVTFLFWAISTGIINGAQFYKLAIISSLFIGAVLLIFSKKLVINNPYVIILRYPKTIGEKALDDILKRFCSRHKLRNVTLSDSGNERIIEAKIKNKQESAFLDELKKVEGVKKVMMFSYTGELTE